MNQSEVIAVTQQALYMVMKVSAPILITGLIVGLIISIFQATTQINDQTLSFVPKIIAVFIVLLVSGAWMINTLIDFTNYLFIQINTFTR
ncbi:MAG: flagellar biosynthesis protein FliQ [Eubacteriales bacterium]|jgi:flagellar biosynthetic protein FliQ|nr:flagellar biosynthesis protein FliQ [Eubacteriales bacterium]